MAGSDKRMRGTLRSTPSGAHGGIEYFRVLVGIGGSTREAGAGDLGRWADARRRAHYAAVFYLPLHSEDDTDVHLCVIGSDVSFSV